MLKKITLRLVTGAVLTSSFSPLIASAEMLKHSTEKVERIESSSEKVERIEPYSDPSIPNDPFIEKISPFVYKSKEGFLSLKTVPKEISSFYEQELQQLNNHFSQVNEQIENGELAVTDDLEIVENSTMIRAAAATKNATVHWWGYQYVLNNAEAVKFANLMEGLGKGSAAAGTGVGSLGVYFGWGKVVKAIGAVAGSYYLLIAWRVRSKNTSKGVIVNITHASVFTVTSR